MELESFSPKMESFSAPAITTAMQLQAMALETVLAAGKSLLYLLIATGSLLQDKAPEASLTSKDERFPIEELHKKEKPVAENQDGSDTEDDDEEDGDEDGDDDEDDDDAGDEDFSGEGEEEGDPEDDPVANGRGGNDDEDGDEDDDDDDDAGDDDEDEDEEDEDEDEDEDEVPQPPAKKRK